MFERKLFLTLAYLLGISAEAQQLATAGQVPAPLNLTLRCDRVQTGQESKRVRSASLGFGNPTSPETTEDTPMTDRTVLVELRDATGRLHLPQSLLTPKHPAGEGRWFPLSGLSATEDSFSASFIGNATGQQILHINRSSGVAEIVGYGDHLLRGVCRIDRAPKKF